MSWAYGVDEKGQEIGYAVADECPVCKTAIHRGLSYVCGGMHGGDTHGCGRYFCDSHLYASSGVQLCKECDAALSDEEE